jgi:hypothetical protein
MPSQNQRDEQDTGNARRPPPPLACENFLGINTTTTRSGVPDQQMYWCDGFIPLSPRNLRILPGIGSALFTAGGGLTVVCFYFYNIGSTPYAVVFLSDGSVVQVQTPSGPTTTILPAGSILAPSITNMGIAQYGSQYLLIVANQANGYWIWDGSLTYTGGSLAPLVTLTNVGSGYTAPPIVTATGGFGSGAMFQAQINSSGNVSNVLITNPGTGYHAGDVVTLVFTGGNQAGSGASLTAHMSFSGTGTGAVITANLTFNGAAGVFNVTSITINNGGSGYSSQVQVVVPGGTQSAVLQPTVTGGVITAVKIVNSGAFSSGGTRSCTITDNGYFFVSSVTGTPSGSGYGPNCSIAVSGGGTPKTQATITPNVVSGVVNSVNIVNGGIYGTNVAPTLVVNDSAVTAAGTVSLAPFGIQGNCVETYAGRVWIAQGAVINFTAPGSVTDFATSDGGGTTKSSDSFLRVGYTRLIQTNGFLFLVGDSSMNYISGVQVSTAASVTTTTYTNNNSDPEIGTPYPASVTTLGTDIFLANQNGIYVSSGGTFQKKSEPLDGVYNTASGVFNGMQLSAAKALIFGKLCWMVLVPIVDPVLKTTRNKIFMFNEKFWWSSEQDVTLQFIQAQEINSVFQPWGTDGTHIYPLFTTPSTAFTKTMQSKLWDAPNGYDHTKSSVEVFAMAQFLGTANLTFNIYVDNENGITGRAGPYPFSGTTNPDPEVTSIMPPQMVGQVGVLTGMTVTTTANDGAVVSLLLQDEIVQYRG